MALSIYYPSDCQDTVPAYQCNACPDREKGGVTTVAFIKKDFAFVDPTDPQEWIDGIEAGSIMLIAKTRGQYDGGSAKYGEGFGRIKQRLLGYDYKLTFMDEDFKANKSFYDAIDDSNNWILAWFTESLVWLSDTAVTTSVKDAVDIDIEKDVVWEVEVSWFYKNKPRKFEAPAGIAESCFGLAEV